jgi:hypothetical protein
MIGNRKGVEMNRKMGFFEAVLFPFFDRPQARAPRGGVSREVCIGSHWIILYGSRALALWLFSSCLGCVGGGALQNVPAPGRMMLDISASFSESVEAIPERVYVFPPLLMDGNGVPLEQYQYTVASDGGLVWTAPSVNSGGIHARVMEKMEREGYELLSFNELQNEPADHSILVLTSYYTTHWENDVKGNKDASVHVVFVRLAGATFPASLDPKMKVDIFNQELIGFYNSSENEVEAIQLGLSMAVKYIGKNKHWMGKGFNLRYKPEAVSGSRVPALLNLNL